MTSESFRGDQKLRKKLWRIVKNKNGMKGEAAHRRPTGDPQAVQLRPPGGRQAAHRRLTGGPELTSFMHSP